MDKKTATQKSSHRNNTNHRNYTTSHLDLLPQFDGLKQTGPDRWIANCPAHEDRSPSLAIKDAGDRILCHCFAGCEFREIADALGVLPSAFFEAGRYDRREYGKKFIVPYRDALIIVRHEMWVLVTIATNMQKGQLDAGDSDRLVKAGARIESAWRACNGQ